MIHVGSGDERGALSSSWGGANGPFLRHSFVSAEKSSASGRANSHQDKPRAPSIAGPVLDEARLAGSTRDSYRDYFRG